MYEYARRVCRLSDQDRYSAPSSFQAAPNVDYMENQCAPSKSVSQSVLTVGCYKRVSLTIVNSQPAQHSANKLSTYQTPN